MKSQKRERLHMPLRQHPHRIPLKNMNEKTDTPDFFQSGNFNINESDVRNSILACLNHITGKLLIEIR